MPHHSFPVTQEQSRSYRWWIVVACLLLLLALVAVFLLDRSVDLWVASHHSAAWETGARICSRFFAWHWLMLGAGAGLLFAPRARRRDWMRLLCVMMVAASLAGLSADVLRGITGRTRPSARVTQGWYGVRSDGRWLVFNHAYNSFPSGHTSAAMGFAFPLFLWRRRLGLVALPFLAVVAGARVYVGAHHVSDVLAGAALGTLIALWVWRRSSAGERLVNAVRSWRVPA